MGVSKRGWGAHTLAKNQVPAILCKAVQGGRGEATGRGQDEEQRQQQQQQPRDLAMDVEPAATIKEHKRHSPGQSEREAPGRRPT